MYYKDKQIWLEGPAWDFYQLNLKFESENQLKILNFVEEFKNMSNLIESHSGRQLRKPYLSDLPDSCI